MCDVLRLYDEAIHTWAKEQHTFTLVVELALIHVPENSSWYVSNIRSWSSQSCSDLAVFHRIQMKLLQYRILQFQAVEVWWHEHQCYGSLCQHMNCLLRHIFEWYDTFHRSFCGTPLRLGVGLCPCHDLATWNAPCDCLWTFNTVYWYEYIFYCSSIYQLCLNLTGCRMSDWRVIVTDEFGGMFMFLWRIWRYCLIICLEGLRSATNPVKLVGMDLELTRDSDMIQEIQV